MLRSATLDPTLTARVVSRVPLYYAEGADPALDRPAHIRGASSLAWVPGGIALIQDDANFIAVIDPTGRNARAIPLPAGHGGRRLFDDLRGNKKFRTDLEACVAMTEGDGVLLLAFGSGAGKRRKRIALVDGWEPGPPRVALIHAPRLYEALGSEVTFAGSELNIEGAVQVGTSLRLFSRGNGAPRDGVVPVNASCELDCRTLLAHLRAPDHSDPPLPTDVQGYQLGDLGGVPLGFTDVTLWRERILYTAAAELSPDATSDGPVAGSAVGVIDPTGTTRWTALTEASGAVFSGKVEGIVPAGEPVDLFYAVTDADDPEQASDLLRVQLSGPWA